MSSKNLTKKNKQAHFTRGAQITFHNLRMLSQASGKVFKIGIAIFVLVMVIGFVLTMNKTMITAVFGFYKAHALTAFHRGQSLIWVWYQGNWGSQNASSVVNDLWFKEEVASFWWLIVTFAVIGVFLSVLCTYLATIGLRKVGKDRTTDKFDRGMELDSPKVLAKALLKNQDQSPMAIDRYRVLPKNFELYQTLIDGTTGMGKTVLLMKFLSYVRQQGDRAVIYDKGCSLAPFFYREGVDHLLNPFDQRSVAWNTWADCEDITDYQNIADALIPMHGQADPFWVNAARSIFVSTASKMQADKSRSTYKLLSMLLTSTLEDISSYLEGTDSATLVSTKAQKTAISIKSILATYVKSLRFLADIEEKNTQAFSIRNWIHDEAANRGSWLFLTSNTRQHASMRPLISVWLTIASLALLEMEPDEHRRIWFIIDEAPSLHAIPNLPETIAEVRKFGGCFVIGLQSYAQLRKTYGTDYAETIFDLLNTRFFFRSPSSKMAEISSKELGEQEIERSTEQYSIGANTIRDGVSMGTQSVTRRLVSPAQIMQLDKRQCYLRIGGSYPVTKLHLEIDQLPLQAKGFMPRHMSQESMSKMQKIDLLAGDAMYGNLKALDQDTLNNLNSVLSDSHDDLKGDVDRHINALETFDRQKLARKAQKIQESASSIDSDGLNDSGIDNDNSAENSSIENNQTSTAGRDVIADKRSRKNKKDKRDETEGDSDGSGDGGGESLAFVDAGNAIAPHDGSHHTRNKKDNIAKSKSQGSSENKRDTDSLKTQEQVIDQKKAQEVSQLAELDENYFDDLL